MSHKKIVCTFFFFLELWPDSDALFINTDGSSQVGKFKFNWLFSDAVILTASQLVTFYDNLEYNWVYFTFLVWIFHGEFPNDW